MRNMAFSQTTPQIQARTKTVTRRQGWKFLKAGDRIQAVERGQGLKKGEKIKKLCVVEIVKVTVEPLNWITQNDVKREGFPGMTRGAFIYFYCAYSKCREHENVTRIEFKYVD